MKASAHRCSRTWAFFLFALNDDRLQMLKLSPFGLQAHLLPLLPPQLPAPLKVHFLHDGA